MFDGLLERDAERAAVTAAIERLAAGEGGALALAAAAGLGKTAVLEAALEVARARGCRVLTARASELEHELAFGVAGQLLAPVVRAADGPERSALLDGVAGLAGPALGLATPTTAGDPATAALYGLYWLSANLAEAGPLVLAVDDAHWADEASMRFIAHLVDRIEGLAIWVLLAARPPEPAAEPHVLERLMDHTAVEVLRPEPLSAAATAELVRERLGADAPERLCRACLHATGGNPFLLRELLAALARERLDDADPAKVVERIGPRSVARDVLERLRHLGPVAVQLAQAVAIFAGGAELQHAAALVEVEEAAAERAAADLARAGILAPGLPLAFLHPVMRTAVDQDMPAVRRSLLHLAAARLLRAEGRPPEAIATHLLAAEPGPDPEAFGELMAAAGGALAAGAPAAAVRYLDRALREFVPAETAAEAHHLRGLAHLLRGDAAAIDDLRVAAATIPPEQRPAVQRALARLLTLGAASSESLAVIDDAIAASAGRDPELHARCMIDRLWILFMHDDLADLFVREMRGLDPGRSGSDLLNEAECAYAAHWTAWQMQDAGRAVSLARAGLASGRFAGEGFEGLPVVASAGVALMFADRAEEAIVSYEETLASARGRGETRGVAYAHLLLAIARIHLGQLDEAESDLVLGAEIVGEAAGDLIETALRSCQAIVALERSGPEAAAVLLHGLESAPRLDGTMLHAARGRVNLAAGHPAEALAEFRAGAAKADARGLLAPTYYFPWRTEMALAEAALGHGEAAIALADGEVVRARRFGAAGLLGEALRVAGLVHGGERGLAMLEEAVAVLDGAPARLARAAALFDLGAALRRANRRAAAREPLSRAADLARACGADRLAARAVEELHAAGARLRRDRRGGRDALTPSERRVARMAAAGMTNREIAQQLFLTVRTVEMHMGNALSKLGIASRREIAAAFERER